MGIFEEIWSKVSQDDGSGTRVIRYASDQDLLFIYASGFVDAEKYTFDQWKDAFKSSKQTDDSYIVSREQWISKAIYYYNGPVKIPFNPLLIPEKEYTEAEITKLLIECILPSSQTTKEKLPLFIKDYQQRGLLKDGKMTMTKEVKQELSNFLATYPSPLRILEVNIQRLLRGESPIQAGTDPSKTGYVKGSTTVRTTQAHLDAILGGGGRSTPQTQGDTEISVKDLQQQVKKRPV